MLLKNFSTSQPQTVGGNLHHASGLTHVLLWLLSFRLAANKTCVKEDLHCVAEDNAVYVLWLGVVDADMTTMECAGV